MDFMGINQIPIYPPGSIWATTFACPKTLIYNTEKTSPLYHFPNRAKKNIDRNSKRSFGYSCQTINQTDVSSPLLAGTSRHHFRHPSPSPEVSFCSHIAGLLAE
ncbi:hypothetical protein CEXT_97711 [Caerostris extrusa]|uniref:Uncharacterized protein n=1 Tax=Caerostris extrusa TaxID=172846 RepID=A0AAV4XUS4_CAEEX|nr:hypothetical protein CEXT_97711 [Caerostris extrusa]